MSGFTMIPNDLIDSMADMTPAEFKATVAIYRLIIGHEKHRKEGARRISNSELQEITGLSKQGLVNVIKLMESRGYVSKERGDNTNSNLWVVNSVDQGSQLDVPPVVNSVDYPSQLSVPPVVNSVDQGSQLSSPSTSCLNKDINKDKYERKEEEETPLPPKGGDNPKQKRQPKQSTPLFFVLPENINTARVNELVGQFIAHRDGMKRPLTQNGLNILVSKLAAVGIDKAIEKLELSITNGWQGVFFNGDGQVNGNGVATNGHHTNGKPQVLSSSMQAAVNYAKMKQELLGG